MPDVKGIEAGWLTNARQVPSPNFDPRPSAEVSLLVIHSISLPPGRYGGPWIDSFFCNELDISADPFFEEVKDLKVSAHFLIRRDGELVQYVSTGDRAWHAGLSCFEGRDRCNDFSIGIELEGCDNEPFSEAQYQQLQDLVLLLGSYYPALTSNRIVGHCDIAPGRKTDPGPGFDWARINGLL